MKWIRLSCARSPERTSKTSSNSTRLFRMPKKYFSALICRDKSWKENRFFTVKNITYAGIIEENIGEIYTHVNICICDSKERKKWKEKNSPDSEWEERERQKEMNRNISDATELYLFHNCITLNWDILVICDSWYKFYCPLSVKIELLKHLILQAVPVQVSIGYGIIYQWRDVQKHGQGTWRCMLISSKFGDPGTRKRDFTILIIANIFFHIIVKQIAEVFKSCISSESRFGNC